MTSSALWILTYDPSQPPCGMPFLKTNTSSISIPLPNKFWQEPNVIFSLNASHNWAAKPLCTIETLLACIRGTTTKTGLQVSAFLIEKTYARGIKITNEVMGNLRLIRHTTYPNWNYTIQPRHATAVAEIGC
jgi:hypothetical protein